jgi:hypothetical protein
MRPTNQYSRNTSPNIRRSEDLGWLSTFENLLEIDYNMVDDKPNEENHVS